MDTDDLLEESVSFDNGERQNPQEEEMDITPMIDMTFLLLIYFLVAAQPDQNTSVDLPKALNGSTVAQLEAVVFTVGQGGLNSAPVYLGDGMHPEAILPDLPEERDSQIRSAVEKGMRGGHNDVVVKADKGVLYREVDRVVKSVSKIEGVSIHLAVLETDER
jgi:biopolymer transport protein ExbD